MKKVAAVRSFPLKARRDLVVRISARMAARPAALAEKHFSNVEGLQQRGRCSEIDAGRRVRSAAPASVADIGSAPSNSNSRKESYARR